MLAEMTSFFLVPSASHISGLFSKRVFFGNAEPKKSLKSATKPVKGESA